MSCDTLDLVLYGERCIFLHVIQQQPKSNAFGFGTQAISHQQQKPNPFGFCVQNNAQTKGANDFGTKQNQFKNTWTRSCASSGALSLWHSDNQPQATNHKCTDSESCKHIIVEDFEHERPLWKLTCYSHWKNFPCDIVGDVSYEELRATAYDDAKRGLSMQSIGLPALLCPYKSHILGPLQLYFLQQLKIVTLKIVYLLPSPVLVSWDRRLTQHSHRVSFGCQQPNQSVAASFTTNTASFSNISAISTEHNQFSAAAAPTQNLSSSSIQPPALFDVLISKSKAVGEAAADVQLGNNLPREIVCGKRNGFLERASTVGGHS